MKYKVGDKVRVRKDLELGKDYGDYNVIDEMLNFVGKIVTIKEKAGCQYKLQEDKHYCFWTDEMLEPVEDIIEYKGKKYDVIDKKDKNSMGGVYIPLMDKDLVLCLKEHKEEILDEEEKEYLRNVIKPFRDRIESITKIDNIQNSFILINLKYDNCMLPKFEKDSMYKGMELDKEYTLEDLGL